MNWSRTRMTGLSEFMAPCGIILISLARIRRISSSERLGQIDVAQPDFAAGDLPRLAWIMRIRPSAMVDLPEPDSPTRPSRSLGLRLKRYFVVGVDNASVGVILNVQVLDLQCVFCHRAFLTLGLASSSRPMEIMKSMTNISATMTTGTRIHHHISRTKAFWLNTQ